MPLNPELPGLAPAMSVTDLNRQVRALLENRFEMLWVAGELSGVKKAASGHWYFCLKDPGAQVECAMFRARAQFLDFRPEDGLQVEVRARVTLYEARGNFQLVVEEIRKAGRGALFEAFERLKARLAAEGLFEASRKRALPAFPRAIAIVTSQQAAALRDVLTTLRRRAPMIPVILYPAQVQGEGAGASVARAIAAANAHGRCDVLIACRGGGSLEDLWAFNEEVVARAIVASRLPVVSGVGHETDFSIADFVADLRAPTPTAAAVAASPDREALLEGVSALRRRLERDWRRIVEGHGQRLDHLARRLLTPAERVAREGARVADLERRLRAAAQSASRDRATRVQHLALRWMRSAPDVVGHRRELERAGERMAAGLRHGMRASERHVAALAAALSHLDPTRVLARGYSIVRDRDGSIRRTSTGLAAGEPLDITFSRGGAAVSVTGVRKDND
ncbi:MAG TPA: exodeoxyribonuclease VII large subunit [Usitatibacter sp.]|jgi:exodeoxyribonuclease VII large subunit|nr:exodeoxyribonuclease VII large subunit [Usitatibacter sp.]